MTPRGDKVHALPGRTRFRISGRKRDDGYFERLSESLSEVEGVRGVQVNPHTASVLVIHDLEEAELDERILEKELFRPRAASPTERVDVPGEVFAQFRSIDRSLSGATDGAVDLRTLVFVFLSGAAALQALRGRFLPATISLANYAVSYGRPGGRETGNGAESGERGGAEA